MDTCDIRQTKVKLAALHFFKRTSSICSIQQYTEKKTTYDIMPLPHEALNMDQLGLYITIHGNPGLANHFIGVTIDYAFRVERQSVFGHGLCRILAPAGRNTIFRRLFACLLALPHRYHEAIGEFNWSHPDSLFMPQAGPEFSISRPHLSNTQPNMQIQDVIDILIDNRIPPEWAAM